MWFDMCEYNRMFAPRAFATFQIGFVICSLRRVWLYSVQAVASAGEQTSLREKKAWQKVVEKNEPLNVSY